MKKTAITLAVVLAGFVTVAQAASKDNIWYTGGKLGWSKYHDTSFYGNGFDNRISNSHIRNSQLGAGAFVGYQANQYLGFELGYNWLGRMAYKSSVNNGSFKDQGISLAAKLSYPLTDDLDIYTRLGSIVWRVDSKGTYDSGNAGRISGHETGASPLVAVGLEYAWTKNWTTRLDYQWVNNISNAGTVGIHPNNSLLSIGLSYRFVQDKMDIPTPIPGSTPIVQTKCFTMKSDILFNFDKATLKPEGQKALDQLCSQLNSMDQKDNSVIVLGYTDRIGSNSYNQKLSQARAQSVASYLISKGIPSNKISAGGMGESNPVTGNGCSSVKSSGAIISCLSPDRRVEIEIKGIKDAVMQPQS